MCVDMYFHGYMALRGHLRAKHRYIKMLEEDKPRFENVPGSIRRRLNFNQQDLAKAVAATLSVMRENGELECYVRGSGESSTGVQSQAVRQVQQKSGSGDLMVSVSPSTPAITADQPTADTNKGKFLMRFISAWFL